MDTQEVVHAQRVGVFNATRAEAAQAALDRFAPQRSDYTDSGLNGATANHEYEQALTTYESSPYVAELRRVVTEAQAHPDRIPAYLTPGTTTGGTDVARFTPEQVRGALELVGVQLPADASPELLDAGRALLGTMPDDMLGMLVNPGSQVSFTTGAGVGTPNLVGPNVQYNVDVIGKVELEDWLKGD